MRKLNILGSLLLVTVALVNGSPECRFAPQYSQADLLGNATAREDFIAKVLAKEGRFMREQGVNEHTGLTVAQVLLNERTGMPTEQGRSHNIRDEAIHVAILAKVLTGNARALTLYSPEEALALLKSKLTSLESVNFSANNMAFYLSLNGLSQALSVYHPEQVDLIKRCDRLISRMNPSITQQLKSGKFD